MNLSVLHFEISRSRVRGFWEVIEEWFWEREEWDIFQILTVKNSKRNWIIWFCFWPFLKIFKGVLGFWGFGVFFSPSHYKYLLVLYYVSFFPQTEQIVFHSFLLRFFLPNFLFTYNVQKPSEYWTPEYWIHRKTRLQPRRAPRPWRHRALSCNHHQPY